MDSRHGQGNRQGEQTGSRGSRKEQGEYQGQGDPASGMRASRGMASRQGIGELCKESIGSRMDSRRGQGELTGVKGSRHYNEAIDRESRQGSFAGTDETRRWQGRGTVGRDTWQDQGVGKEQEHGTGRAGRNR